MSTYPEPRVIADGLAFPEGPVVLGDGSVAVVEVRTGLVTLVTTDGTKSTLAEVGGGPNGAALGPDGYLYVVNNGGFTWMEMGGNQFPGAPDGETTPAGFEGGWVDKVDLATGDVTRLYTECEGQPFLGPNDIVFDSHGGFYFTDFGKTHARTMDRGALYYAPPGAGPVRLLAEHLVGPNGVGLSPDGQTLYVSETYTGRLLKWSISGPGELVGRAEIVVATPVSFDSLAVEADGTVVVAATTSGLCPVRPDGTYELIPMPDLITTNICFGGLGLRTAYVTLAAGGKLVELEWPRPGLALAAP